MNESGKYQLISIDITDSILFKKSKKGYVRFARNKFRREFLLNFFYNNPKSKSCFSIKVIMKLNVYKLNLRVFAFAFESLSEKINTHFLLT